MSETVFYDIQATIDDSSMSIDATVQEPDAPEVTAQVEFPVLLEKVLEKDHNKLSNLDYEHSGHTGFQKKLNSANAGANINIEEDASGNPIISAEVPDSAQWGNITGSIDKQTDLVEFVKSKHKAYYNNYTMYEGVAPYGSLATDAVWTITTIVSNDVGGIVSVNTATNQVWNYN